MKALTLNALIAVCVLLFSLGTGQAASAAANGALTRPDTCSGLFGIGDVPNLAPTKTGSRNLTLVLHGFKGTGGGKLGEIRANSVTSSGWDAPLYDWNVLASPPFTMSNSGVIFPLLPAGVLPLLPDQGVRVGECLAYDLVNNGYEYVHVIAHSLGAWAADSLADTLKSLERQGKVSHVFVHITFLDAWTTTLGIKTLGDNADFAEQYLHEGLPQTDTQLTYACNIRLNSFAGNLLPLASHDYPVQWYLDTVLNPFRSEFRGFGFSLTKEVTGKNPTYPARCGRGQLIDLPRGSAQPTEAPQNPAGSASCGALGSVRSIQGVTSTSISFHNGTAGTVSVFWLNYSGSAQFWFTIGAGQTVTQGTYVTHPWLVRDSSGNCLGIFQPKASPTAVQIGSSMAPGNGGAAQGSCSKLGVLRSTEASVQTSITFHNQMPSTVSIYWLDYSGQPRFWFQLTPGFSQRQGTYMSHPWLVRDADGNCLGIFLPESQPMDVSLGK